MKIVEHGIARRCRIDLYTPTETAIREAMLAVERAGCHPLLTEAVCLLEQAKNKVADFVEMPEQSDANDTVADAEWLGRAGFRQCPIEGRVERRISGRQWVVYDMGEDAAYLSSAEDGLTRLPGPTATREQLRRLMAGLGTPLDA
ncbi:hypothetical protein [Limnoglobus roseus]|uniref:Uncharacterized protein n=1 Tax=Limnoglobus roseus TaxID=2598579 RepID=A0A5C1ALA0_9BACT|nr:hypothetical protein [Limnoglobus roseus]QEL18512.1 hypothetical protein PX52LOC_05538 [Limnoglobus roseus]